ncbi:hypothetical protein EDC04DRAFT_2572647 [Pisolithus marmoratus]|nr:hypothetical protein EDC04DRAFT_2572647 [Pisolithus marmoratus]
MSADFHLVDPQGWEYDLQSVHSAYMGYFQLHSVPWYDRSWGHLFETFDQFLTFSWPVITVTDARTGRAHIVTRLTSIGAFLKMIRTRFGETLPQIDNMLKVTPFETAQRHLRKVNDWTTYKKLHATLPAVALSAFRARVRGGDTQAVRSLWASRDKTFLAIGFMWSERNSQSCLEWGYATVRCGHLDGLGAWPPVPGTNYRKGHYIVAEYADKVVNRLNPNYPWTFGESQVIPKAKLPRIIQSVISSLVSPDTETSANHLVLVGHSVQADIQRLEEMKIKLPHNTLVIDTATFQRTLSGCAHIPSKHKSPRPNMATFLHSLGIQPPCMLNNAGNDAFMALYAFQCMVDPDSLPKDTASMTRQGTIRPLPVPSPQTTGLHVPASNVRNLHVHPSMLSIRSSCVGVPHGMVGEGERLSLTSPISPLLLPVADGNGRGQVGRAASLHEGKGSSPRDMCASPLGMAAADSMSGEGSRKGEGKRGE